MNTTPTIPTITFYPNASGVITEAEVDSKLNSYFGGTTTGQTNPNRAEEFIAEFGPGVTSFGDWAFNNCSNMELTELPAGITSIGNAAFQACSNLTLTELPAGIISIG